MKLKQLIPLLIVVFVLALAAPVNVHAQLNGMERGDQDIVNRVIGGRNELPRHHYDTQVQQVGFRSEPAPAIPNLIRQQLANANALADAPEASPVIRDPATSQASLNFVQRERQGEIQKSKDPVSGQNLGQLISKLGMNLAIVLMIGIGFVLVAKQWLKNGAVGNSKRGDQDSNDQLKVLKSTRLDAKSTLQIVRWAKREMLVASDSQGVKSVVLLPQLFDETLEEVAQTALEPEPEMPKRSDRLSFDAIRKFEAAKEKANGIDEKLIQMLLENSDKNKKQS